MSKKIVITGACGFIGSHLTEFFVENGYIIIGFDKRYVSKKVLIEAYLNYKKTYWSKIATSIYD